MLKSSRLEPQPVLGVRVDPIDAPVMPREVRQHAVGLLVVLERRVKVLSERALQRRWEFLPGRIAQPEHVHPTFLQHHAELAS
jgi:hypothetical protein